MLKLPAQSPVDEVKFIPLLQRTAKILALLARSRHSPTLVLLSLLMPGGSMSLSANTLGSSFIYTRE